MTLLSRLRFCVFGLSCVAAGAGAQEGTPPNRAADEVLHRLVGTWRMYGQVMGDSVTYDLEVRRVLMWRFVELHMRDASVPSEYEARVLMGADTTVAPRVLVHWMDSFGAAYSVPVGVGTAVGDTIAFTIDYSTGRFRDVLSANADGTWKLRIDAEDATGWRNFAEYRIVPLYPRAPLPLAVPPRPLATDTTYDVPPRLLSGGVMERQLSTSASALLDRDPSLGGRELALRVSLLVGVDGRVSDVRIAQSSGNPAVDAEAIRILRVVRFTPATKNGQAVEARVTQPLRFRFPE